MCPEQLYLFDTGGVDLPKLRLVKEKLSRFVRAENTTAAYESGWRSFSSWCEKAGRQQLPASSDTVTLYVTWLLSEEEVRTATAKLYIAAIIHAHRDLAAPAPACAEARAIVSAVRRQRRERPKRKAALSPQDLTKAAAACGSNTNLGARDRALLVLGFATSLRRNELVRLQLSDVVFEQKGLAVLVRSSKTDQEGRGRCIGVWAGRKASTDPVRALKAWIRRRGTWQGPLFCRIQRGDTLTKSAITGESVNDAVKRRVSEIGLDPAAYGAHSLRAGAVTAAAELGRSDQEIMGLSGHASASVMRQYVRSARIFSGRNPLAGVL